MTNVSIVDARGNKPCRVCGRIDELRPYGKNGAWVCFDCGMMDEGEAQRQFDKPLSADLTIVLPGDAGESDE
jgi:ribosomal protein L37AE/L43A